MKRVYQVSMILIALLFAVALLAQDRLERDIPDRGHLFQGDVLITSTDAPLISIDLGDGQTLNHLFLYQPAVYVELWRALTDATVIYTRDTLVIVNATENFIFSLRSKPDGLINATAIWDGHGLAHYSEFYPPIGFNISEIAERSYTYQKTPPPSPTPGEACLASCTINCVSPNLRSSASMSCSPSPPWCAKCDCFGGTANAYCIGPK